VCIPECFRTPGIPNLRGIPKLIAKLHTCVNTQSVGDCCAIAQRCALFGQRFSFRERHYATTSHKVLPKTTEVRDWMSDHPQLAERLLRVLAPGCAAPTTTWPT
jgi:hypothetical protein